MRRVVSEHRGEHHSERHPRQIQRDVGDDKHMVWGATESGRQLQVIFVYKSAEDVDYESREFDQLVTLIDGGEIPIVRVIHAMDLTDRMKRQFRRRRRGEGRTREGPPDLGSGGPSKSRERGP